MSEVMNKLKGIVADVFKKPPQKVTLSGTLPQLPDSSVAPASRDPHSGQHKDHWILPASERQKGFVRPVRVRYTHEHCGIVTQMPAAIAETYARAPTFYSDTFCVGCKDYFPIGQFFWLDTSERVGS